MAKAELWDYPVSRDDGVVGTFPVARGTGDRGAVGRAAELLEQGEVLGIFPQGTCLPTAAGRGCAAPRGWRSRPGAPIVPVCIVGSEKALRPGKFKVGLPRIKVIVCEPIEVAPARPTVAAAKELTRARRAGDRGRPRAVRAAGARLVPGRARRLDRGLM